jgi:drug/metabolite transporter (DMT)-like permease
MSLQTYALILFSVGLSGLAQVVLKWGVSADPVRIAVADGGMARIVQAIAFSPGVIAGLAMYGLGAVVWLGVLTRAPLSLAYPCVGLSFIITAAMGYLVFNEVISPSRIAGIALVVAGVVLVGRG